MFENLKNKVKRYKNIKSTDILFRNVEPNQLNGSIIYRATSSSSKIFQITDKQKKDLPFGVATTASKNSRYWSLWNGVSKE